MILSHEDLSAIEAGLGPEKAAPIINALEKLEREQKVEVRKDLLMELATKADLEEFKGTARADSAELKAVLQLEIAELRSSTKADLEEVKNALQAEIAELRSSTRTDFTRLETEVKGEIKRLEMLIKVLIGLVVVSMGLFSPAGVELVKLLK